MVQKSVGFKFKAPVAGHGFTTMRNINALNGFDGRQSLAGRCAKRAEIMLAQQVAGGLVHGCFIKASVHPTDAARFNAGAHGRFQHHVGIAACCGAGTAMKGARHDLCPLDGNIVGQMRIGAAYPRVGFAFNLSIKMHHLHQAMHTRVGAASTQRRNLVLGKFAQRSF